LARSTSETGNTTISSLMSTDKAPIHKGGSDFRQRRSEIAASRTDQTIVDPGGENG
jgi:hypothetical protein